MAALNKHHKYEQENLLRWQWLILHLLKYGHWPDQALSSLPGDSSASYLPVIQFIVSLCLFVFHPSFNSKHQYHSSCPSKEFSDPEAKKLSNKKLLWSINSTWKERTLFSWLFLPFHFDGCLVCVIFLLVSPLWEALRAVVTVFAWWPAGLVSCCRRSEGLCRGFTHTHRTQTHTHINTQTHARVVYTLSLFMNLSLFFCLSLSVLLLATHMRRVSAPARTHTPIPLALPGAPLSLFPLSLFPHKFSTSSLLPRFQLCYTAKEYK